jgi:hypothetical protein
MFGSIVNRMVNNTISWTSSISHYYKVCFTSETHVTAECFAMRDLRFKETTRHYIVAVRHHIAAMVLSSLYTVPLRCSYG